MISTQPATRRSGTAGTGGRRLTVDPIRSLADIRRIKTLLADHPRNLALFTLGCNTALRASDICKLTREEVRGLQAGDDLSIRMVKTANRRSRGHITVTLNADVVEALRPLLSVAGDGPLFVSEKTGGFITEEHLCRLVQDWCDMARIPGRHGSHTLRKTWGYLQRTVFKTDWPTISKALGHSSQAETMIYLGIQPKEIKQAFMNCI